MASRKTLRANSSGSHGRVADRLERKPRFIESSFQNDERLRIEGAVVEPPHGSILNLSRDFFVIR
jgi:hypothetical protein